MSREPRSAPLLRLPAFDALVVVPAEIGLAAHARAGRDGQRAGLEIADHHAGLQQIDARGALDIAFQFAGDRDLVRAHAAGELGAGLDGEIALDVDVALELAGDADAAAAFDLAFDRDVGGDQRFLAGQARLRACARGSSHRAGGGGGPRRSGGRDGGVSSGFDRAANGAGSLASGAVVAGCRRPVLSFQKAMALVLSRVQVFEASAKKGRRQSIRHTS